MNKATLLLLAFVFTGGAAAEETSDDVAAGQQIYASYCANICHQPPTASRLRPAQWRVVLQTMQARMQSAGMPPLSAEQLEQLHRYLTQEQQ